MKKFTNLKSIPAYLPIVNIDTDMIIPKQFLKTIKRTGLGKNLFFEMRYDQNGNEIKDFILKKMLKDGGKIYGMVPYLYHYHAPKDLKFQDYFRFSKDALAYLFKDFKEIELYPVRGRISTPFNIMFAGRWKKYIEKTNLNIFLDKFANNEKNLKQCSGFNFIVKN